ncbi:YidC/Oxa1 family membrane protein insertase [Conexibacter sp. DBS9H8]|uniref:YidC/Oxa1 family membrane protein insertase n=1 Tax=Conexibacter sp. DBS9H8 TaxID=2937801 RepID=UPI00200D8B72|nr:YidC/Oxa1 family membrane protein insertase [Conexibacter sp. DBS9H8]
MLLDANIFQPLIDVFAAVLKFFHNDIGVGWGLAIVLLTVFVRLALVPLGIRQFHSMQRMAMHMPEMKAIKEKYKENPQRMQQETMAFYKENNINPFSSCLPLLIQWPFLIGLFWTLRGNLRLDICPGVQHRYQSAYATKHHISLGAAASQTTACGAHGGSSFLFIHDLTNKAHGLEMIILLVLYVGTSIGSSRIMMMPGTDKNQQRMMLILPVVFAIITIQFPAGALLYYIIFNLWMVVQQSVFKELIGKQYRHPAGVAIGIPGEGTVSGGGGLLSLFGLSRDKVSADVGAAGRLTPAVAGKTHNGAATQAQRGAGGPGVRTGKGTGEGKRTAREGSGADASAATRTSSPPASPRKKKKRSGRRR